MSLREFANRIRVCQPRAFTLLAVAAFTACSDAPTIGTKVVVRSGPSATAILARGVPRGAEDRILQIEEQVPGFGGYFVDPAGDLVIFEADPKNDEAARSAVRGMSARYALEFTKKDGILPAIHVLRGAYPFSSLVGWKEAIGRAVRVESGIALLDADEGQNRVRVGITSTERKEAILALADSLSIPRNAIAFELRTGTYSPATSVLDKVTTRHAGIKITSSDVGACTMGFTVTLAGSEYFLTANHCTGDLTGTGNESFNQAVSPDQVG